MEALPSSNPENSTVSTQWLVTVAGEENLQEVAAMLVRVNCEYVGLQEAVNLDNGEYSLPVNGPGNLDELLETDSRVTGVFNNSAIELFETPEAGDDL